MKQTTSPQDPVTRIVQTYGDLVFDLCESVLWSPANAQVAFRAIIKEVKRQWSPDCYSEHERAWILRLTCDKLRPLAKQHGRKVTASEQIQLDALSNVNTRLKQFDVYFHRLPTEDQILLLLKDKYAIATSEIASVMGVPEGSLKIRRQQALRTLEEWVWDHR